MQCRTWYIRQLCHMECSQSASVRSADVRTRLMRQCCGGLLMRIPPILPLASFWREPSAQNVIFRAVQSPHWQGRVTGMALDKGCFLGKNVHSITQLFPPRAPGGNSAYSYPVCKQQLPQPLHFFWISYRDSFSSRYIAPLSSKKRRNQVC